MASRTEDLHSLLSRIPDPAIRSLFTPEFILCSEEFDRFTVDTLLNLVSELGFGDSLSRGTTVGELLADRGWSPRAAIPLAWFFRKLAAEGEIVVEGSGTGAVYRSRGTLPSGEPDRAEARSLAIDPQSAPAFAVVHAMVEHVPAFLRGELSGEEVLFHPAKLPLWFDYFSNDNLLYQINNRLGAEAVVRALPTGRPASVVEIGGGSGSAALAVAERLARDGALSRIGRYVFTEIVPTFLRRTERTIRARWPALPVEFQRLDMDRDFAGQGIEPESADGGYALNTMPNAKELARALARIPETL